MRCGDFVVRWSTSSSHNAELWSDDGGGGDGGGVSFIFFVLIPFLVVVVVVVVSVVGVIVMEIVCFVGLGNNRFVATNSVETLDTFVTVPFDNV